RTCFYTAPSTPHHLVALTALGVGAAEDRADVREPPFDAGRQGEGGDALLERRREADHAKLRPGNSLDEVVEVARHLPIAQVSEELSRFPQLAEQGTDGMVEIDEKPALRIRSALSKRGHREEPDADLCSAVTTQFLV